MDDGIGLAKALLGLHGFRVLDVSEGSGEVVITVETVVTFVGLWKPRRAGRGRGPDGDSKQGAGPASVAVP